MEDIFFFIAVLWGTAAVLWIIVGVIKKKQEAENEAQPVQCKAAKVIEKQQIDSGAIVIGEPWILFETENGDRVRLNAKPNNNLVIGDVGMLTWQGRKILKFERSK